MSATSKLPPLNALRAFEAVARLQSFRKAADELFVTPAAVSHQIKALEEQLGVALFERYARRIELTPAAQAALPLFQQGFDALAQAVFKLRSHGQRPHLTVSATPTFVSRWLMPRLIRFMSKHPGIDVRLLASGRLISPLQQQAGTDEPVDSVPDPDIEIRFDNSPPEGQNVDFLFRVEVVPMCHPRLLMGNPPLKEPGDLRHHTLLHGDGSRADRSQSTWARWLRKAKVKDVDSMRGLQFDHSTLALEAAADGLGVTLAMPLLASDELTEGKVIIPFPIVLSVDRAYYAVASDSAMTRPEVSDFRAWLVEEAAAQAAGDAADAAAVAAGGRAVA